MLWFINNIYHINNIVFNNVQYFIACFSICVINVLLMVIVTCSIVTMVFKFNCISICHQHNNFNALFGIFFIELSVGYNTYSIYSLIIFERVKQFIIFLFFSQGFPLFFVLLYRLFMTS